MNKSLFWLTFIFLSVISSAQARYTGSVSEARSDRYEPSAWSGSDSPIVALFLILIVIGPLVAIPLYSWFVDSSRRSNYYNNELARVKKYVEDGDISAYRAFFATEKELREEYGPRRKMRRPNEEEFEKITGIKLPDEET